MGGPLGEVVQAVWEVRTYEVGLVQGFVGATKDRFQPPCQSVSVGTRDITLDESSEETGACSLWNVWKNDLGVRNHVTTHSAI